MKNKCWVVCILFFMGISAYAQIKPEEILQNALIREATLDYSYECILNKEDKDRITTVKQRRNSDGSVWRVVENKGIVDLSRRYWSFDTKKIYNSEGCIDLFISQYETVGIVTQSEIPLHRIGKDSTFKMTSITYDGRDCWKIAEHQADGYVYEVIIDKKHEFIVSTKNYDSAGKLLFSSHLKNLDFNSIFVEEDFCVPSNAKLKYAKNMDEWTKLDQERVFRHSDFVQKQRKQMKSAAPQSHGSWLQQWNRMTIYDIFDFICQNAPWVMLPIAICAIGCVIWKKNKEGKKY